MKFRWMLRKLPYMSSKLKCTWAAPMSAERAGWCCPITLHNVWKIMEKERGT